MSIIMENISYTYMKGTPYERTALKEISVEIHAGEFVAIIGHSGSGKSTLVQHMSGLLQPLSGKVQIEGIDISQKGAEAKAAKRKIGLVFQYPEHQLFAESVFEDVAFGPVNMGLPEEEVKKRVEKALHFVRLPAKEYAERSPFQLSGGQMRRVAIAGVMAMQPEYLILDEPTAGLDPTARDLFYEEIKELRQKSGMSIILVTHNMEEAMELSDRMLVMSGGQIIADGKPEQIFNEKKDIIKKAGVDVPDIVSLVDCLKKEGLTIKDNCFSKDELVDEIIKSMSQGVKKNAQ